MLTITGNTLLSPSQTNILQTLQKSSRNYLFQLNELPTSTTGYLFRQKILFTLMMNDNLKEIIYYL